MIYISVYVTLDDATHKWSKRSVEPSGTIVMTDTTGDAVHYKYTRKKLLDICKSYYMNPDCRVLIDPYVTGIDRYHEKYAHQELGFVIGAAMSAGLPFKILYKRTYYRYFGLLPKNESAAYSYCLANYPKIQMLYKFKDQLDADRACSAYLMTQFMESKQKAKVRWNEDLKFIIEELDDSTEECEL